MSGSHAAFRSNLKEKVLSFREDTADNRHLQKALKRAKTQRIEQQTEDRRDQEWLEKEEKEARLRQVERESRQSGEDLKPQIYPNMTLDGKLLPGTISVADFEKKLSTYPQYVTSMPPELEEFRFKSMPYMMESRAMGGQEFFNIRELEQLAEWRVYATFHFFHASQAA